MKKLLAVVGLILVGITALSGCIQEGTGTLVLQITDAPGDLNISEALVTMSRVEVHRASFGNNNSTGEWVIVVEEPQTFDLIALQNVTELFGSTNLSAGWYTQIRLHVDEALVTIDGVQYNLTIPSETVKLIKPFKIEANETTTLTLDFDVQKSVHDNGDGEYILKPTIKVITED